MKAQIKRSPRSKRTSEVRKCERPYSNEVTRPFEEERQYY